ncbi:MAG: SDR family NAD(P)-dependent oxidoreductase [Labilithrix sp.]|nr:SDR family NAD(P)-dependent oxidoreductase [Labilithrix sp.]
MPTQRTAVVTGANRGIGLAVSQELASRGLTVFLVARDAEAGLRAARDLSAFGDVQLVPGDLSSPTTTRIAARRIAEACPKIDVLVHNAGVWPSRLERDDRGIERAFAVNHLAPFLLNHLLEDALGGDAGARIVQVSAGLYVKGRVDVERTARGDDFHAIRTYATTKLCNLLLLERFARRLERRGVTINAVHPGVIRTSLGDRPGALGLVLRGVKRLWKAPDAGARPVVRLALDPALAGVTGRYFDVEDETPLAPIARDEALAARLWEQAEVLCAPARGAHHAGSDASQRPR